MDGVYIEVTNSPVKMQNDPPLIATQMKPFVICYLDFTKQNAQNVRKYIEWKIYVLKVLMA